MNRTHPLSCAACALALTLPIALRGAVAETVLWPSSETVMKAQSDSQLTLLPDGSASVATGASYAWPGMRMDFACGERDLSDYGRVALAVSNMTDRTIVLNLSVKGRTVQGRTPGGSTSLKPFAAGVLSVDLRNMPWTLDAPLELVGMNGFPTGAGGSTFDLKRTFSFHIFIRQDGLPGRFAVSRVSASASGVPQKVLSAATFLPFVDRYGQFKHDEWPGKIHSDAELAEARTAEAKWLAENAAGPIPDADIYGGWATGPQLKATGFFRTEKVNGKWWFVDPEGHLFWSHGIDCVRPGNATGITHRESYFEELPAKDDPRFGRFWRRNKTPGAHGFYKDPAHADRAEFDFAGANLARKYGDDWLAPYAELAHRRLKAWGVNTIANWSDARIYSLRRTPYTLCLGTYGTPRLKGSTGWWGALPDPFDPAFASTFRARAQAAAKEMKDDPWCLGVFVDNELSWNDKPEMKAVGEQYFAVISSVLKEELPNHLYLGCRIAFGNSPDLFRACAKYCDVVSVNMYARAPYRELPADAEDKPMINGEFHFGALDRGLFHTGLVATTDQAERAACYRNFVNACLDHPRYIGTHWFQWQDQALTGRSDGENYQIGFLTGADTPYPELVAAARDIGAHMYARRFGKIGANEHP